MNDATTKKTTLPGILMLSLCALIWGTGFIAQSIGMERIEAFTFNAVRNFLGGTVLLPFVAARLMHIKKKTSRAAAKRALTDGISCGVRLGIIFCIAANFQQFAFYDSTAGKIAFLTALYILFVPLIGVFLGKRVPAPMWGCIALGFVSLYFLCMKGGESLSVNKGDLLALICAVFFAIHILMIETYTSVAEGLFLSCTQFFVSGMISLILAFFFESPSPGAIFEARGALLYAGVFSSGIAYTFQILGQARTEAVVASLLLCSESVFAVIAAFLVLGERMTAREGAGCVLMLAAIVGANLLEARDSKKNVTTPLTENPSDADAPDGQKTPPGASPL
ncbi:MAG: DMT family transporter [Lachnospiraceae bacterium]|nr:DMT family transporter [Lachnospiraceae bacterium]